MEQAGSGLQAGPFAEPLKLRPQIAVSPAAWRVGSFAILAVDNVFRTLGGQFKGFAQDWF